MASGIRPRARWSTRRCARSSERQLPDGGFNIYPQGPSDVSATVKAYFSLKVAGVSSDDPRLARARERILALGGIQAANSYVKVNLSLFDLYPREDCPAIPPEIVLLGTFIYQMSSWTRAIVIPLSIVHSMNPRRPAFPQGLVSKSCSFFRSQPGVSSGSPGFHLAECLPAIGWRFETVGEIRLEGPPAPRHSQGGRVDTGAYAGYTDGFGGRSYHAHDVRDHGPGSALGYPP